MTTEHLNWHDMKPLLFSGGWPGTTFRRRKKKMIINLRRLKPLNWCWMKSMTWLDNMRWTEHFLFSFLIGDKLCFRWSLRTWTPRWWVTSTPWPRASGTTGERWAETLDATCQLIYKIDILQECAICFCWHARCDLHPPQKCFTFDLKITSVIMKTMSRIQRLTGICQSQEKYKEAINRTIIKYRMAEWLPTWGNH